MADKKITQLTERVTTILGTDLLPLVGNTTTTPANFKVQVKNFLSQIQVDLPQTTTFAFGITANVTANATTANLAAGFFSIIANSSIGVTVQSRTGLIVRNTIQNGNSNVTGRMWGAHITLDPGNSNFVSSNTFGLVIEHTLDANVASARIVAPRAYLAIKEKAGSGNNTLYLLDVGAQGNTVSGDLANVNSSVVFTKANTSNGLTHKLKISVNGADYWVLCSNAV
jgi:hypothetical protein